MVVNIITTTNQLNVVDNGNKLLPTQSIVNVVSVAQQGLPGLPPIWGNITGTIGNQTDLQAEFSNYLTISAAATEYDPIGSAATAQSNAQAFASNASNITSGTVAAARVAILNQNTTGTAANITATSNSTLTSLPSLSVNYSQLTGTVPTWNQNTTGQAGTVATINGLIASGSNVTITGSGTSGSPYTISSSGGGGGSVTAVSVASSNGFAGTSSGGSTPALTLSTSVTGVLKGNGTAISAATSGTDYVVPSGSVATLTTGRTISITGDLAYTSPSFNGSGNVTAAGTLATVNSNVGSFTNASITVNAKGLITAASSGSAGLTNPMTTVGDIIVGGTSGTPTRLADVATGNALISGGVGVAPSWGKVGLTTAVSGTLPVGSGGTGTTSLTANRVLLGNGTSGLLVLGAGTTTTVLHGNASGPPTFGSVSLTNDVSGLLPLNRGGTNIDNTPTTLNLISGPSRTDNFANQSSFVLIQQNGAGYSISGMVPMTGGKVIFVNGGIYSFGFLNQSGYSASNAVFKFPSGADYYLPSGSCFEFAYNSSDGAWEPVGYPVQFADYTHSGIITAGDYNAIYGAQPKLTGNGGVAFSNGTQLTNDPSYFSYDVTNRQLGVGTNAPQGGVHAVSPTLVAGTPSSASAGLYLVPSSDPVTGLTLNQYPEGSGGYTTPGTFFDYQTYSQFNVAGYYMYLSPQDVNYTDSSGYSNWYNQLYWSISGSIDQMYIQQNSPSSILESVYAYGGSFVDNNDMSASGSLGVPISGYVANGSNLNITYTAWSYRNVPTTTSTPLGKVFSSSSISATATDPNDGQTYIPTPSFGGSGVIDGWLIQRSSDGAYIYSTNGTTADSPSVSWSAPSTVTPTSFAAPAIYGQGDITGTGALTISGDIAGAASCAFSGNISASAISAAASITASGDILGNGVLAVSTTVTAGTNFQAGANSGISTTVALAKLTPVTGSNGSMTITGGIITAYTAPT